MSITKEELLKGYKKAKQTSIEEIVQYKCAIAQIKMFDMKEISGSGKLTKKEKRESIAECNRQIGMYKDNIDARKVLISEFIEPKIESIEGKLKK